MYEEFCRQTYQSSSTYQRHGTVNVCLRKICKSVEITQRSFMNRSVHIFPANFFFFFFLSPVSLFSERNECRCNHSENEKLNFHVLTPRKLTPIIFSLKKKKAFGFFEFELNNDIILSIHKKETPEVQLRGQPKSARFLLFLPSFP